MEKRDYSTILFTPEEAGVMTAGYLRMRKEYQAWGVPFGLASMDKPPRELGKEQEFYVPLMPGEVECVISRPGHGKTGTMVARARKRAEYLRKVKMDADRAVVYITLEQSVEELNAFNIAADRRMSITQMAMGEITDAEWKACLEDGINRRYIPIWNIGYSSTTAKKQVRIDLDGISGALHLIEDQYKKKIDLVFVDYLQRMPFDRAESKTIGVSDNLDGLKNLALQTFKAPFVIGAQATRDVDARVHPGSKDLPIPAMDDGQWTSNIEQTSDHVISLVRPRKYYKEGEAFGSMTVQGNSQLLVSVLKQKLGASNFARWVFFDPIYNKLDELEMRNNV
jgi:replicative DNA helicase